MHLMTLHDGDDDDDDDDVDAVVEKREIKAVQFKLTTRRIENKMDGWKDAIKIEVISIWWNTNYFNDESIKEL